eukprot:Nk52_evm8s684 gene=Nk52_evmTU8s684
MTRTKQTVRRGGRGAIHVAVHIDQEGLGHDDALLRGTAKLGGGGRPTKTKQTARKSTGGASRGAAGVGGNAKKKAASTAGSRGGGGVIAKCAGCGVLDNMETFTTEDFKCTKCHDRDLDLRPPLIRCGATMPYEVDGFTQATTCGNCARSNEGVCSRHRSVHEWQCVVDMFYNPANSTKHSADPSLHLHDDSTTEEWGRARARYLKQKKKQTPTKKNPPKPKAASTASPMGGATVKREKKSTSSSSAAPPVVTSHKLYIQCPYDDKEECKEKGGRWDRDHKSWFIPPGLEIAPFQKWL